MHIHVDADGSARVVLDAWESVSGDGSEGRRHTIAHNSMVAPDDINRYAQLGIIATVKMPLHRLQRSITTSTRRSWVPNGSTTAVGCPTGRRSGPPSHGRHPRCRYPGDSAADSNRSVVDRAAPRPPRRSRWCPVSVSDLHHELRAATPSTAHISFWIERRTGTLKGRDGGRPYCVGADQFRAGAPRHPRCAGGAHHDGRR